MAPGPVAVFPGATLCLEASARFGFPTRPLVGHSTQLVEGRDDGILVHRHGLLPFLASRRRPPTRSLLGVNLSVGSDSRNILDPSVGCADESRTLTRSFPF